MPSEIHEGVTIAEPCYEGEEKAATPPNTRSELLPAADPSAAVESDLTFTAHEAADLDQAEEKDPSFSSEMEVMWHRLCGRGQSVAERMNIDSTRVPQH